MSILLNDMIKRNSRFHGLTNEISSALVNSSSSRCIVASIGDNDLPYSNLDRFENIVLNDSCKAIIDVYFAIQNNVDVLVTELQLLEAEHNSMDEEGRIDLYRKLNQRYKVLIKIEKNDVQFVELASCFIYLYYAGMYRRIENDNLCQVRFMLNRSVKRKIDFNIEELIKLSRDINRAILTNHEITDLIKMIEPNDLLIINFNQILKIKNNDYINHLCSRSKIIAYGIVNYMHPTLRKEDYLELLRKEIREYSEYNDMEYAEYGLRNGFAFIQVNNFNKLTKSCIDEYSTLRNMYIDAISEIDKFKKGKKLELLIKNFFSCIQGFSVDTNVITETEEIDVFITNQSSDPFWAKESQYFLGECKNWKEPIGKNEYVVFREKLLNRNQRAKIGFFIGINGFTCKFDKENLRNSREDYLIIELDGADIDKAINSKDINGFIKNKHRYSVSR